MPVWRYSNMDIKIANNGPNVGTGIRLKDLIPDGLIILL